MEYARKFLYGMEHGMEDFRYGMEMEWKKITSMEYGKIVFHSIPYHALPYATLSPKLFKSLILILPIGYNSRPET